MLAIWDEANRTLHARHFQPLKRKGWRPFPPPPYENKCYLAMANIGMYEGATRGLHGTHGDSAVHNFDGTVLNKINGPGESTIKGPIDLEALRRVRAKPFHPVTIRAAMYAKEYETLIGWPTDAFRDHPIQSIDETRALFRKIVDEHRAKGIDTAPREE